MGRFKFLVGLLFLLILLVVLPASLVSSAKDIYFKSSKPFMSVFYEGSRWFANIMGATRLAAENRVLKRQLERFHRFEFEHDEYRIENMRLQKLLDFQDRTARGLRKVIAAQVVGRTPSGWKETILLDKGAAHGIELSMPVVTEAGLVGKVAEVTKHASKIKLVTHPQFRVGAVMQASRQTGVVYGTVDGECRMKYISLDADIQIGDRVETAGYSKEFPKGILIGTVDAVWKEPGQIYKVASIHLSSNMNELEEVLCVIP